MSASNPEDPADQSEKRDWDVPRSARQPERQEAEEPPVDPDAPHPTVHGETPDQSERRDWEVP